jgi:hypothetical protein
VQFLLELEKLQTRWKAHLLFVFKAKAPQLS